MRPFLLLLVLAAPAGRTAAAQTGPTPGPAVATLGEALRTLAEARGLSLAYPSGLVAGRTTACPRARWADRALPDAAAMRCVLGGTGLAARTLPSGTLALVREAAPPPAPRLPRPHRRLRRGPRRGRPRPSCSRAS